MRASKGVRTRFTLRLPPDIHRAAAIAARRSNWSLNDWIIEQLRQATATRETDIAASGGVRIYDDDGTPIGVV